MLLLLFVATKQFTERKTINVQKLNTTVRIKLAKETADSLEQLMQMEPGGKF